MGMVRSWSAPGRRMAGFTLVELMVSLALGLVILAGLYSAYQAAYAGASTSRRLAQVTEDAAVAMSILRTQIGAASYSRAIGSSGATLMHAAASTATWVRGCDTSFQDNSVAIGALTCASTDGPDAIAVAFEADAGNSVVNSAGTPLDCLGNATSSVVANAPYYYAYHRLYVSGHALFCTGTGNAGGQALVDNIQDMVITYGVSDGSSAAPRVVAYQNAESVTAAGTWARVMSVRVCLVVRSSDEVLDSVTPYPGCDPFASGPVTPVDRRIYRAFTSTFLIKNRAGSMV